MSKIQWERLRKEVSPICCYVQYKRGTLRKEVCLFCIFFLVLLMFIVFIAKIKNFFFNSAEGFVFVVDKVGVSCEFVI